MGYFYFDESIHERGNFIIGAWVYSRNDISASVFDKLKEVGLQPLVDEFKSSATMSKNIKQRELRDKLKPLFENTRLGTVVVTIHDRLRLGENALKGLRKIILANRLVEEDHQIFLDEGIPLTESESLMKELRTKNSCKFHVKQDSRKIGGLQLADLVAHTLATLLLEDLGLTSKRVYVGEELSGESDGITNLGWELWRWIRFHFFNGINDEEERIIHETSIVDIAPYALFISDSCSQEVAEAAMKRFGTTYYGCVL